ncbi:hypothetical protein B4084_4381 [Bacillus cereus]|nr:hypothetical protein B4084_4381 [Bacillus cereus]
MPQLHNEVTGAPYFRSILNYNLFTTNFNVLLFFSFFITRH